MERISRDLRMAVRRFIRRPAFTVIAIASLAIGIGANTAIFSLVNAIIIRDLPFDQPEELVDVYRSVAGFSHATFSYPDLLDLQRETRDVFSGVAGSRLAFVQTDVDGGVEGLAAELVTGNFFPLTGVDALVGRTLQPEDDVSPGGHPVVVLGYGFWQRRYGGDPSAVGQEIRLNGRSYSIIGVLPKAYTGNLRGMTPAIYAPMMMVAHLNPQPVNELEARGNQSIFAKARLLPGVTLPEAQGVADRIVESLHGQYPGNWQADNVITLVPTDDVIMNPMIDKVIVPAAALMLVVVALVLLIACANLASFLLAQAVDRKKEVAIQLALGATRGGLIRQFLTETVVLAAVGGTVGLVVAAAALRALAGADLPLPFPITLDLSLDSTVLGFTLLVTLAAGLLFGMAPALQATRPDVAPTLKDESTGEGRTRLFGVRGLLVVTQVAVSLMLLVGAGLFLRSLEARLQVDPGFGYDPAGVMTVLTAPDRYTEEETRVFFRELQDELAAIPGVEAVGMTGDLHLNSMSNMMRAVVVDGVQPPPGEDFHLVDFAQVDPGFFEATGVSIVRGRGFTDADEADGAPVAVVSEAFARRFWPEGDALGRTFQGNGEEHTVVGIARDAKVRSLGEAPRPFLYAPYAQNFNTGMTIVARTATDAERTALEMVAVARRLDPEIIIFEAKTMERHLAVMLLPHRLSAIVVGAFGAVALLLASIGLYGVVSYGVASRSREVGIRMSLGAEPGGVVRLLMAGGMKLVGTGFAVGLALSIVGGRLMSGLLYGVSATDPVAFLAVPAIMAPLAALAAWVPARRASRIDPVRALRAE